MEKKNRKRLWSILYSLAVVIIPIIFEIVNTVTGDWTNATTGKIEITTGKLITILIGVAYLGMVIYVSIKDYSEKSKSDELANKYQDSVVENQRYRKILSSIENVLGYAKESVQRQTSYLKKNDYQVRELELNNFATTICTEWYNIMKELFGDKNITVNIYHKYKKSDRKEYQTMIAHEGHISQPKYFGVERLLKSGKKAYFCEKILMSDNPEYQILLDPNDVAKAFGKDPKDCKYKQYIAIPIMNENSMMKLMLEINVIDECILGTDVVYIKELIKDKFSTLMDYLLLMESIEDYAVVVKKKHESEVKEEKQTVKNDPADESKEGCDKNEE